MKFVFLPPFAFAAILSLAGCVTLDETQPLPAIRPAAQPTPICAGQPLRKVLVTAFPLSYPEQLKSGEYMGWAQTTGAELAHRPFERQLILDGNLPKDVAPGTRAFANSRLGSAYG